MTKVHLIADEKLGGLLREYVETDRKAVVGDYVTYAKGLDRDNVVVTVSSIDKDDDIHFSDCYEDSDGDQVCGFDRYAYKTLEPTDVVHHEGARYKLADRNAEIGEKVVVVDLISASDYEIGDIYEVVSCAGHTYGFIDRVGEENGLYRKEYLVLVPVEPEAELTTVSASEQVIETVDEAEASPSVIEMLANLSRRIVRLEDEVDTLHRNNVKLAEELANHKAEAKTTEVDAVDFSAFTEAVVERVAAKLLGGGKR